MDNFSYSVPVLFVFFNRKKVTLTAFEKIKKAKPQKLYLASDGYRENIPDENKIVEDLRNTILQEVNWDCEIHTLFQDKNLGCGNAVYTAINWLFENEKQGVIIEDDCVVQDSFFLFIEELLVRYRDDYRIGMIDGANYIQYKMEDSYCFSRYKSTNGWATWKRAWENMDINMEWRKTNSAKSILMNMGYLAKDTRYWKYHLNEIDKKHVSAWDWQWYFTLASQNQLSIFPKVSLVSNIGFGKEATHTTEKMSEKYLAKDELIFPLIHPKYILPDYSFDQAFNKENNNFVYTLKRYTPYTIKTLLKKILR